MLNCTESLKFNKAAIAILISDTWKKKNFKLITKGSKVYYLLFGWNEESKQGNFKKAGWNSRRWISMLIIKFSLKFHYIKSNKEQVLTLKK